MLGFYSQFVSKGDLCFDVGANLGDRAEVFLRLGAFVVAIEPQDTCMQRLREKYRNNGKVILVQKALGVREGEGELLLSDAHTISSMSKEWVNSVKASGRFSAYRWEKTVRVPVTTLDRLIEEYGKPVFCKIDVEGFEFQVLSGLSQQIKAISFEFTPEFIDSAINSIRHLSTLGKVQFNYAIDESMCLALSKWVGPEEICKILLSLQDKTIFGDVYAVEGMP
jgi:FkbM family methyltransferase